MVKQLGAEQVNKCDNGCWKSNVKVMSLVQMAFCESCTVGTIASSSAYCAKYVIYCGFDRSVDGVTASKSRAIATVPHKDPMTKNSNEKIRRNDRCIDLHCLHSVMIR